MQREECGRRRTPMKMFGVSGSCCHKPRGPFWAVLLYPRHLTSDTSVSSQPPGFLHHIDICAGYCVPFCEGRCADLAWFSSTLFLPTYPTSCFRSVCVCVCLCVLCHKQPVITCTSYPGRTPRLMPALSLLPVHITLCVYLARLPSSYPSSSPSLVQKQFLCWCLELTFPVLCLTILRNKKKRKPQAHKQRAPGIHYYSLKALF